MNLTFKIKFRILVLLMGCGLHHWLTSAYGQNSTYSLTESLSDSLAENDGNEETYYRIGMLRLERWILKNTEKFKDPGLLTEVARLKKEAENFAAANDFYMANIWLETIWEQLQPEGENSSLLQGDHSSFLNDVVGEISNKHVKKFNWSRELITGVDIWRSEFNIAFEELDVISVASSTDSTFFESSGNPYSGLRFRFDYGRAFRNSFQGTVFFKYSRDYLSGDANLKLVQPMGSRSSWRLENRFEGTSYFRNIDLKYWQNTSSLMVKIQPSSLLSFSLWDEFLLRRYDKETSTYPNYFNNTVRASTKLNIGFGSLLEAGYRNVVRDHPVFKIRDYNENRVDFAWLQSIGRDFSFSLDNEIRFRDYTNAPIDTIFQDYWEDNFIGDIRLDMTPVLGTEVRATITRRDYKFVSEKSLPDYWFWEFEPKIYFNIGQDWRLSVGFHYSEQNHQELADRVSPQALDATLSFPFEDYYRYGPFFTVELFQINGILFSLRESFVLERYPNTRTNNVDSFNLYSDRNINSILFFLTWNLSSNWQLNALANFDNDRSQKDRSGDSKNTLVGLDLNYSF